MYLRQLLRDPSTRLDIVAGLVDGILNALTLAAARLLKTDGVNPGLAVRIAIGTGVTTLFVFFVAHYAELRAEIARAERQLNLTSHGQLASSRLGRAALRNAVSGAAIAAFCGMVGSAIPLLLCTYVPGPRFFSVLAILGLLAILGGLLAKSFRGSALVWSASVVAAGALITWAGFKLNLVS